MRTTVTIHDALLQRAKRAAAGEEVTLSEYVEEAVRERLLRAKPGSDARKPFKLVTHGKGGLLPGLDWGRLKDILDDEDAARHAPGFAARAAEGDAPSRR